MSEEKNHIDSLIEKSLQEATVMPSERFWQKAERTLLSQLATFEKNKAKRWRKFAFLFAGLALLFFSGTVYFFLEKSKPTNTVLVNQAKSLQDFDLQNQRVITPAVAAVTENKIPIRTKNKPESTGAVTKNTESITPHTEAAILRQDPQITEFISPSSSNEEMVDEPMNIVGKGLYALTYFGFPFDISDNELTQLSVSRRPHRPFSLSVYGTLGESGMSVKDNRTSDAQFPSDVLVKNRMMSTLGVQADYRITRHWGVSVGLEQLATKTGINSYFFADTTGTGVVILPEEGEEEEGEGEGEIGTGNTTVQSSISGYDIVTNLGLVHLVQPKNVDCTLLGTSIQEIKYVGVPVQLHYLVPIRSFTLNLSVGGVYHHLTNATALLRVSRGSETLVLNSTVDGLKSSFFSSRVGASVGYGLNSHWTVQLGCEFTRGMSNINASTPFGTRMHTFAGRSALSYNF
jgi:hypothetical protein